MHQIAVVVRFDSLQIALWTAPPSHDIQHRVSHQTLCHTNIDLDTARKLLSQFDIPAVLPIYGTNNLYHSHKHTQTYTHVCASAHYISFLTAIHNASQYDYLQRDAHNCGVKVSCDFNRLIKFSKVRMLGCLITSPHPPFCYLNLCNHEVLQVMHASTQHLQLCQCSSDVAAGHLDPTFITIIRILFQ